MFARAAEKERTGPIARRQRLHAFLGRVLDPFVTRNVEGKARKNRVKPTGKALRKQLHQDTKTNHRRFSKKTLAFQYLRRGH